MQENSQPFESGTGYYTITYIDEGASVQDEELFDEVFSKLKKIQKETMLERISKAEAQLVSIDEALRLFIEERSR